MENIRIDGYGGYKIGVHIVANNKNIKNKIDVLIYKKYNVK